jgi:putative oxygen-independent coproporphyrinogen III oxidase
MAELSLYLHFPWCVRKCPYCDFNSHPLRGELDESAYLDALQADLHAQLENLAHPRIATVFFGGGTPSLFSPAIFARLLATLSPLLDTAAEVTLEANPGTTEHYDMADYHAAGINRLSLGAQSFDDEKLRALGRIHGAAEISRSFDAARSAGFDNINLDIMYGLPNQTRLEALADLTSAIELAPEHLSWYQLTLEPKTEFAQRPPPLPADIVLEGIELAGYRMLAEAGFDRYEVSAFARSARQCRHNLNYWSCGDYHGVGAGAHGKLSPAVHRDTSTATVRTRKASQPRLYLSDSTSTISEQIPTEALPGEFMLNALRLREGLALDRFGSTTALSLDVLEPTRSQQIRDGLLRADRIATTERGYAVLDSVIQAYL